MSIFYRKIPLLIAFGLLALNFSSCLYQQPDEDFLQEVPTTNNPSITRATNSNLGVPV